MSMEGLCFFYSPRFAGSRHRLLTYRIYWFKSSNLSNRLRCFVILIMFLKRFLFYIACCSIIGLAVSVSMYVFGYFLTDNAQNRGVVKSNMLSFQMSHASTDLEAGDKSIKDLYFAHKQNPYLVTEERRFRFSNNNDLETLGREILEALIEGSQKGLMRTVPADTKINAIYISNDSVAYVDLSEKVKENHPGGCQMEFLTIYSIVNSLVLNIPQIESVKILIGGRESTSLAGHIDLRFPLKANLLLIH